MAERHSFPQSGDEDDAENFAQLVGQTNLVDFVIDGMTFNVDYGIPEVSVSTGVCAIGVSSDTASSTGETRLQTATVVQVPQETVSLSDGTTNHIYVEPDLGTDDNGSYAAYTNESNASTNALKIGEIDTSGDTDTQFNRAPPGAFSSSFTVEDESDASSTLLQITGSGPIEAFVGIDATQGVAIDAGQTISDDSDNDRLSVDANGSRLRTEGGNVAVVASDTENGGLLFKDGNGQLVWDDTGAGAAVEYTVDATTGTVSFSNALIDMANNNITNVRSAGQTVVVSGTQYEIQKDGTDGAGIINFKTT